MTITLRNVASPFSAPTAHTFHSVEPDPISIDPSSLDSLIAARDEAMERGDAKTFRNMRRQIRAWHRYHGARHRDAAPYPISHDDHLANTAHQHRYHSRGDVERMTVGLQPVSEWRPPLVRKMNAAAGIESVTYDVPGVGRTTDWLSIAQRNQLTTDIDATELPSDYVLSSIAAAELYGCSIDQLDSGMRAKPTPNLPGCE